MSKRKPYVRPMTATWWLSNPFYIRYMLREATCLFVGGYSLTLLCGLYALKQGPYVWAAYLQLLASPLALLLHSLALLMALFSAVALAFILSDRMSAPLSELAQATQAGVQSTPSFIIGEFLVQGAIPYPEFTKAVDSEALFTSLTVAVACVM